MDQLRHRNAHRRHPEAVIWEDSSCLRIDEQSLESPVAVQPSNPYRYLYEQYLHNQGTHDE